MSLLVKYEKKGEWRVGSNNRMDEYVWKDGKKMKKDNIEKK